MQKRTFKLQFSTFTLRRHRARITLIITEMMAEALSAAGFSRCAGKRSVSFSKIVTAGRK